MSTMMSAGVPEAPLRQSTTCLTAIIERGREKRRRTILIRLSFLEAMHYI